MLLWWWHIEDRQGGYDGDGGMKLHTCCQNLEAGVQPTPQRTTGQLFSDRPGGRRPQKTLVKVAIIPIITWHSYPMHWWNRHGIPLQTHLYPERRAVIVLWSKWSHLSFKQTPGGFNHKGWHQGWHCHLLYIIFASSNHKLGHLDTNLSKYVQVGPNLGRPSISICLDDDHCQRNMWSLPWPPPSSSWWWTMFFAALS